jgi:ABC transport system ATP-binding/permease protein
VAQRPAVAEPETTKPVKADPTREVAKAASSGEPAKADGLSFTERKRLDALPGLIERLEAEIAKLGEFLSDPDLFTKEPVKFRKASEAMAERQVALAAAEEEWLTLAERA